MATWYFFLFLNLVACFPVTFILKNDSVEELMKGLFDAFDRDGNGVIDAQEFFSGLAILCSGDADHKIHTAFSLFDADGDGYIDVEEMTRYLTSVFLTLNEITPELFLENEYPPTPLLGLCFLLVGLDCHIKL